MQLLDVQSAINYYRICLLHLRTIEGTESDTSQP